MVVEDERDLACRGVYRGERTNADVGDLIRHLGRQWDVNCLSQGSRFLGIVVQINGLEDFGWAYECSVSFTKGGDQRLVVI